MNILPLLCRQSFGLWANPLPVEEALGHIVVETVILLPGLGHYKTGIAAVV